MCTGNFVHPDCISSDCLFADCDTKNDTDWIRNLPSKNIGMYLFGEGIHGVDIEIEKKSVDYRNCPFLTYESILLGNNLQKYTVESCLRGHP